ncbi:gliding motility lipoprotein GldH [Membranihabitans maritimus]|uniref:gliding motility lipoprotein GldH n=1 Tax=Membranihabitans maritimus TaxID=2904244 RepID=UPI001F453AAA
MVNHNSLWLGFFSILLLAIFSCENNNIVLEEEIQFNSGSWPVGEVLNAYWEIEDLEAVYRWSISVDHSDQFKYQNLYLLVKSQMPGNKSQEKEISLQLANPNTGVWLGKGSASNIIQKIVIQDSIKFENTGEYQFNIEQYSRDSTLQGINSISILLERLPSKK